MNITTPGVHQLIPATALSTVARMATTGFAKYLATELAPQGIRVNIVLPGWISTRRVEQLAAAEAAERGLPVEAIYDEQRAAIPMRRFGEPSDVADAIAFLRRRGRVTSLARTCALTAVGRPRPRSDGASGQRRPRHRISSLSGRCVEVR